MTSCWPPPARCSPGSTRRHGHAAGRPGEGRREDGGRPGEGRHRAAPGAGRRHRDQGGRRRLPAHPSGSASRPATRRSELRDDDTGETRCRTTPARRVFISVVTRELARQRARPGPADAAARTTRRSCAPSWPPRRPSAACSTCCGPSSRHSSCSPGSTSSPSCSTSAMTSAPPSPGTRRGRGHPPTFRCSMSSPSCSAPLEAAHRGGQRASAPPTRPSTPRRSSTRRSWWRSSPRTGPSSCRSWRRTIFTAWIADRNTAAGAGGELAERARHDRTWAYGHVIVDEAQELSAMDWRMVLRRCPSRSMTVVGDLAQTAAPGGADSWAQVLDPRRPGPLAHRAADRQLPHPGARHGPGGRAAATGHRAAAVGSRLRREPVAGGRRRPGPAGAAGDASWSAPDGWR